MLTMPQMKKKDLIRSQASTEIRKFLCDFKAMEVDGIVELPLGLLFHSDKLCQTIQAIEK